MSETQEALDRLGRRIWQEVFGREPRWRYYECGRCPWRFCYTTERMNDGKFAAFIYKPVGRGARTKSRARAWRKTREVHLSKRRLAEERALRWLRTHFRQRHS